MLLNKTTTYTYDAGGNITLRTEYSFTLVDNLDYITGTPYSYSYPISDWRDQLVDYNGEHFVYDGLGNPTTYRDRSLTWSHGRQLDSYADIATYRYNVNGIRTSKTTHGFTTNYFLNGNTIIRQTDASNTLTFYYGVDGVTGFHLKNNIIDEDFYYKKNAQNDIIGIYNSENTLICKYIYDAWGKQRCLFLSNNRTYVEIEDNFAYNDTSILNRFIAFKNPFRYRSYYYDFETELYYLNSRYYDPELCRFINADSIDNLDTNNLNGLNLYNYCGNNPVTGYDPNGDFFFTLFATLVCSMAAGYLIYRGIEASTNTNIANGTTSILGGTSTIATSAALFGFGPVGWVLGGIGLIAGLGTMIFGTAELQQGITGNNWMLDAGMSEDLYYGLYMTSSITSFAVSIAGISYMNSPFGQRAYAYQNVGKFHYTKTVANHYPKRPYIYNTTLQKYIIKYGSMHTYTPNNPNSIFKYGNYEFIFGKWEITLNLPHKYIIHFLYRGH